MQIKKNLTSNKIFNNIFSYYLITLFIVLIKKEKGEFHSYQLTANGCQLFGALEF